MPDGGARPARRGGLGAACGATSAPPIRSCPFTPWSPRTGPARSSASSRSGRTASTRTGPTWIRRYGRGQRRSTSSRRGWGTGIGAALLAAARSGLAGAGLGTDPALGAGGQPARPAVLRAGRPGRRRGRGRPTPQTCRWSGRRARRSDSSRSGTPDARPLTGRVSRASGSERDEQREADPHVRVAAQEAGDAADVRLPEPTTRLISRAYARSGEEQKAAAPAVPGGAATALSTSSTSAGTSQTRWCTQVTGLTRQPTTPVSANPVTSSPAATPPGAPATPRRPARPSTSTSPARSQVRRVEPGDHAPQRLVGRRTTRADPVGVPQRLRPELPRGVREPAPPRAASPRRPCRSRPRGPPAAGDQQVER